MGTDKVTFEVERGGVTGSDRALIESDVSHVTGSNVIFPRIFSFYDVFFPPRFFLL